MDKRELLENIYYEGYYDENKKLHIEIDKENVETILERLYGADIVHIKFC